MLLFEVVGTTCSLSLLAQCPYTSFATIIMQSGVHICPMYGCKLVVEGVAAVSSLRGKLQVQQNQKKHCDLLQMFFQVK